MARAKKTLANGARQTSPEELAALRRSVEEGAEARPGVYRFLSADGGVLYVGKSKRVRERLLSYFRAGPRDKGGKLLREARAIRWDYVPSEFAALREELAQIKHYRPRFNFAQKRDAIHYVFLRLSGGAAPRLAVARGGEGGDGLFYGPFVGPALAEDAARELSDALGLRDCKDDVPLRFRAADEPAPKGLRAPDCVRHEVGKCLGPCVSACTEEAYRERVGLVRAFLEGESRAPLALLRREMERSKETLAYERAALYRDRHERLARLASQFRKVRFAPDALTFAYPVSGFGGEDKVYLIRRGTVRAELAAPRTTAERMALAGRAQAVFGPEEATSAALRPHEIEEILLLTAWFRKHPGELARALPPSSF
jgi:excinuclease ABC subunit C